MIIGKKDKNAFRLFVRALFILLRDKEGVVIELDKKKYIVHKGRSEDGEMLLKISDDLDGIKECDKHEGTMLWFDEEEEK